MKKTKKSLALSRETLRQLDTLNTDEVKKAKGGFEPVQTGFTDCYSC